MKTNNEPQTVNHEPSPSVPLTVYRPNQRHEMGWIETWVTMARNTWQTREMIWQLCKRDLTAQYKKSFIGMTWVLINPILGILPWVFAQKVNFVNPGATDMPYPVYVMLGKTMWGLFMGFYGGAAGVLGAGGGLLMQVNYSHEAMLMKNLINQMAGFLLNFVTNLIVMMCFGVFPSIWILALPLAVLPMFFLGAAMGLVIGLIRTVATDLNRIIGIAMGFLMWTTPIVYSNQLPSPLLQHIIKWNPLTYIVCSCRDIMVHGRFYDNNAAAYFGGAAVAFLLFLVSLRLFFVSEQKIIERMI